MWSRLAVWLPTDAVLAERDFEQRHRWLVVALAVHVPLLVLLAVRSGWDVPHLLLELGPVAALAAAARDARHSRVVRSVVATIGLVATSSALIHVTDGLTESHFHFFVVVAAVALYETWAPFLVCLGWVLLHHGVVGIVAPSAIYSTPQAVERPVLWALLHGGYVLMAAVAAIATWRSSQDGSRRAQRLLAATRDAVYLRDACGAVLFANHTALDLVVGDAAALVGRSDHDVFGHVGDGEECGLCEALSRGAVSAVRVELELDGVRVPVEVSSTTVPGPLGESAVVVHDITERLAAERQLRRLALEDSLTGLPNRALLRERLEAAIARARRRGGTVALLLLDLDHFKDVNDTYGHGVGDELLKAIASRLVAVVRDTDTVARLGGDEFVVLLDDTDPAMVMTVAERLTDAIRRPLKVAGTRSQVSVSIGARIVADGAVDAETVMRDADTALYASKRAGRRRMTVFDEELGATTRRRVQLATELESAIDAGQLRLHYQPIVDETSLEIVAVEALVRWAHPQRGLLGPATFVPQAEESQLVARLGDWVLDHAWADLARWQAAGRDVSVSVNVSRAQLQDRALADQLAQLMETRPVDPRHLWLEVTESAFGEAGVVVDDVVAELRHLGVRLAIDDFGTGRSSLASLQELAVDAIKVDRRFVSGVDTDPVRAELLDAALRMGGALGLRVVVEGVETLAELAVLRATGPATAPRFVQGYLFGRPVPASTIDELLATGGGAVEPLAGVGAA